jgi:murein DD-endopeptidase MepM/ murein hydrolase activator NlpD
MAGNSYGWHDFSCDDLNITEGETYSYYVTAYDNDWSTPPSQTVDIEIFLPPCSLVSPKNDIVITDATPTFTWSPVGLSKFSSYNPIVSGKTEVWVHDLTTNKRVWQIWFDGMTISNVIYNQDGKASPLVSGHSYAWSSWAWGYDIDGNSIAVSMGESWGFHYNIEGTYAITASVGPNGSISPSGDVTVNHGSDKSFTITPDTGYQIADVLVDGSSIGAVAEYTVENVTADHTIYATFEAITPVELVKPLDDYENNISQRFGNYLGYYGGKYYDGFHSGEDISVVAGTPVYAITSGRVVKISDLGAFGHLIALEHNKGPFKIPGRNEEIDGHSYHYPSEEVDAVYSVYIHVDQDNLSESDWVETGEKIADIADISAAGLGAHLHFEIRHPDQEPSSNWTMVGNSSNWSQFADGTYNGYYKNLQEMVDAGLRHPSDFLGLTSPTNTYTITASAGSNGSISPSGDVAVNEGSDKSFTIVPDTGYQIDDVLVDGSSIGAVSSHTFNNVTENHTISATFISVASGPVHNLTKDTYYDTIQAALDNADSGNTIEVDDGIYDESITFPPLKKIILRSVNGPSLTTIRGDDSSRTVTSADSLIGTTLKGFTITHADGLIGRGIYISGGYLIINNCTIFDNSVYYSGGGIYNIYGTLTITESTISGNTADNGGGIYNNNPGTLTITGSTISGNTATGDWGIGGAIANDGTLTITESTISGNTADNGGGIYNRYGTLKINRSTISGNTATGDWGIGGGIWAHYNSTLTITESTISGNAASAYGGGICSGPGTLTITESTISGNTGGNGGGIYSTGQGTLTITGNTISNNTSDTGGNGGGIYSTGQGTLTITGNTIFDNSVYYSGGGIYLLNSFGTITIGGDSPTDKNTICGNYKCGYSPSLDQQIRGGDSGDLYETYKYTNYISAYCGVPSGLVHNLTKDTYYDTIQAALDDADSGNTIEVADGTYSEMLR